MKVFISHSWKNKSVAQLIAESLENKPEVWLDIQNLKPGDAIQPNIDKAIAQMDAVVVLWSKDSVTSQGVDAEIETASRLRKKILPVLLDQTPTDRHRLIKGLYGINFDLQDPKPGLLRVQAGLVRMMLDSMDFDAVSALNDLTTFEGAHQYIQEYRNRKEISGSDSLDWAIRSMETCNKSYTSLSALRGEVGETLQFIQGIFARIQATGDDRAAIQAILNEVIRHPKNQTKEFKTLISFIEGKLSSLAIEPKPVALQRDAAEMASDFARKVERHSPLPRYEPEAADSPAVEQPNPALEIIHNYIRIAPQSLQQFMYLASVLPVMSLKSVANELHAYLINPNDLIPDDQNGLLGFIDDAWLIHNTIYRCIEAGFLGAQDFKIQWDVVVQADSLVIQILPPQVRSALEQLLMQFLRVIANESAQYQPQFTQQAQFNSYAAFMGDGSAVGGASTGGPQSVDDLFISGGQWTWVGKT